MGCGCDKGENLSVLEGFIDAASFVPNQNFAVSRIEVTVGWRDTKGVIVGRWL